jgi:hypothetical protein
MDDERARAVLLEARGHLASARAMERYEPPPPEDDVLAGRRGRSSPPAATPASPSDVVRRMYERAGGGDDAPALLRGEPVETEHVIEADDAEPEAVEDLLDVVGDVLAVLREEQRGELHGALDALQHQLNDMRRRLDALEERAGDNNIVDWRSVRSARRA